MMLTNTIRLLLDGIGRSDEYEFYLRKFQSDRSASFSVFIPDQDSVEQAGPIIAANIDFLLKLGLVPTILLAGPGAKQMQSALLALPGSSQAVVVELADRQSDEIQLRAAADKAREQGGWLLVVAEVSLLDALRRVCPLLSKRLLFMRMRGLLRDQSGQGVSLYRIRRNEPRLSADDIGLRGIALALHDEGIATHVAVSSPSLMLKEIFTVKGAGTILRPGSQIRRVRFGEPIDMGRLRALIRESFQRDVGDRELLLPGGEVYLEEDYRAAIVLEQHPAGYYMSKFSVGVQARGEGTAQELWERASGDHPKIFWRARERNPIARWYNKLCDGRHQAGGWFVFWKGVLPTDIPALIDYCLQRGDDFRTGV